MKALIKKILNESVNKSSAFMDYLDRYYKLYKSDGDFNDWIFTDYHDDRETGPDRNLPKDFNISAMDIVKDIEEYLGLDHEDAYNIVKTWATRKSATNKPILHGLRKQIINYMNENYQVRDLRIFGEDSVNNISALVVMQQTAMAYDLIYTTDVHDQMADIFIEWLRQNPNALLLLRVVSYLKKKYAHHRGQQFMDIETDTIITAGKIGFDIEERFNQRHISTNDVFDLIEIAELF